MGGGRQLDKLCVFQGGFGRKLGNECRSETIFPKGQNNSRERNRQSWSYIFLILEFEISTIFYMHLPLVTKVS